MHVLSMNAPHCETANGSTSPAIGMSPRLLFTAVEWGICDVYCEEIRVFKAGSHLNTLAWNNEIGFGSYFVGFWDRSND